MDFVKNRWYCIDVKFPGQYSGNTTTTLQPKFYDGVGNGGEGTSNAPNNIEDKKNHMLLLIDSVGKNISVSGSGSASVAQGCISNPSGSWFGGNNTVSGNDGYGIHDVYMGLMYYIGGSGHQSAQPSVLFANGSPPEILSVGGDILTNGRIGVGTVQPNAACHVIGDINVEGEFRQNNSTLIGIGSSSSAGAPLQVLASTSNTSPTNNGILLSQTGTSGTNHAIMAMKVNGSNSGDPFVSWDTDVTGWSMGIDNSDSDILKIANSASELQTDTHMEFSSSGTDFKKTILANGSAGTNGQVLTSSGSGGTASWTTVSGGGGGSSLSGTNTFEWGTGVSGKETNAGKIGYSTFTSGSNGALDIVGAGTSSSNRNVRIFDHLGIGTGSPEAPLHIYESTGSSRSATSGTLVLDHGDSGGSSCIVFPSRRNNNSDYGYIQYEDSTNSGDEQSRLIIGTENDGQGSNQDNIILSPSNSVGIGLNTPSAAKLTVSGYGSGHQHSYRYLNAISDIHGPATASGSTYVYYSIWATGRIRSTEFNAVSDERIKKDIVDVVDVSALEKIRLLKPKTYKYKDTLARNDNTVYGFIAQEVANVIPYAVTTCTDSIPNILTHASITRNDTFFPPDSNVYYMPSNVHVSESSNIFDIHLDVSVPDLSLSNTSTISITTDKDVNDTFRVVKQVGDVITITSGEKIQSTNVFSNVSNVFVYGEEVSDFHNLNKDSIFTVATAALQEVDRQLQAEKTKVATLETQVANLLARVTALENT